MASSKISPQLLRELRRHVKVKTKNQSVNSGKKGDTNHGTSEKEKQKKTTLLGCTAFLCATGSLPFIFVSWIGSLSEKDGALTHAQIRRGAFNNSGSKDIGKDPNWNFRTGTRIQKESDDSLFTEDDPDEIDHGEKFVAATKRFNR